MRRIVTVLGEITPGDAGVTSAHDHILIDMSAQFIMPSEASRIALAKNRLSMENLGTIRANPWAMLDNLVINDVGQAKKEMLEFKKSGGSTIVDATSKGLGRDLSALYEISKETGVNIVAGCGYYTGDTHPGDIEEKSSEEIRDEIVEEITEGVGFPGVRCGMIGEIGVSAVMSKNEEKVLKGASLAQKETGAPIQVHIFPWPPAGETKLKGSEVLDIIESQGADLSKVCINHTAVARRIDIGYISSLIERGAFVSFDNFGHEFMIPLDSRDYIPGPFSTDWERCEAIYSLLSKGYIKKILVANDICHKHMLCGFGGGGYGGVIKTVFNMMQDLGAAKDDIDCLLVRNPAEFLSF